MKDAREWEFMVCSEVLIGKTENVRDVIRLIQADALEYALHITLGPTIDRDIFDSQRRLREEIVKLRA